MEEKDWESKTGYTHYIAKVGNMFVQDVWMLSGGIKLNWAETKAKELTKEQADFCKKHAGAKVRGVKVEVTYFEDDEFE